MRYPDKGICPKCLKEQKKYLMQFALNKLCCSNYLKT